MICRLTVGHGHLEVITGETPSDFLGACRELAAAHPDARGVIVLRALRGEPASVDFQGEFSPAFEQRVRNLWALTARGEKIPSRLSGPVPVFQVTVGKGRVTPSLGSPPAAVLRFCEAFARANPGAAVHVEGVLKGDAVSLRVTGDMAEDIRARLQRRWAEHGETAPAVAAPAEGPRPRRGSGPALVWVAAGIVGAVALFRFLSAEPPGRIGTATPASRPSPRAGETVLAPRPAEQGRPLANGELLETRGAAGPHAFYVDNRGSLGVVARLVQRDGEVRRAFFVGPAQTAEVDDVPDGVYDVVFVQGRDYSRATGRFESGQSVWRLDKPFEYATQAMPNGTRYWRRGVVTHTPSGTLRRVPVSDEWARR